MNCEECTDGMARFPHFFEANANSTETMLNGRFCKDPAEPCEAGHYVHSWLPAVLDKFVVQQADMLCQMLEACDVPPKNERFVTCADCKHGMHFLVNHLSGEQHVVNQVAYLQGEGFCDAHTDHPDCPAHVAENYPQMHHFTMTHVLENSINDMCADQCEQSTHPHSTHPHSTHPHSTHPHSTRPHSTHPHSTHPHSTHAP